VILVILCFSCNSEKEKTVVEIVDHRVNCKNFSDYFEGKIASFWIKELADMSRHSIVKDPLNADNQVLKIDLKLEDFTNGGKRSEIRMSPKDSFGYKTTYSFKFLLPDSFFQKDEVISRYIIHQWHDEAFPGFDWKTNPATQPPIHLLIEQQSEGDYYLVFNTGIKIGSLNEVYSKRWNEKLKPNKWYTFSCEILWSLYNAEGYASAKLDGKYFINWINSKDSTEVHWISRRNMYNVSPNYYMFGLYRAGLEKHDRTIYFDDFMFESYREKCNL
jgi:hypothetical protein